MMDNKLQVKGFVVWGICALFFLYEFFLRTVMGTYQSPLTEDLHITSLQFSLLSTTIFSLVYGIMQIPVGIIVDNIGLKKSLIIGITCCTLSSFGFAYAYNYEIAMLFRTIMGFGASFGFICLLMSVYDWMPHKYSAIFIGLSQFIGTLGPMAAAGPLESLSDPMVTNWRFIFLALSALGVILIILCFFLVENNHQKTGRYTILYKPEKAVNSIFRLFAKTQPWYIALLSASLYFTVEYLSENEGRAFLALKGVSPTAAAYMITISWLGYAVGSPILGLISDILERRTIILKACAGALLVAVIMILYLPGKLQLQIAFLILGIAASGQSVGLAIMAEQFKKQFVAVGFGLNNAMITLISAVSAPLIGLLIDQAQSNKAVSLNDYLSIFNILIVIALAALAIAILFVKETYCKSTIDFHFLSKN